jgi:hypothetical protein
LNIQVTVDADEVARMQALLARICADDGLHARFLNSLSLMEHIGSRKIMASQAGGPLASDTLKHLAEETRHAFFFKRAAEAVAGRPLSYDAAELLAGPQAGLYMGRLDAFVARQAKGAAAYLYMSLIVEVRAVWFYRLYQSVLKGAGSFLKLTSVLAEEERHLDEMRQSLAALGEDVAARMADFSAFESRRFAVLLGALERAA